MPKSQPPYSTAAIHLADAILKASGSGLKNYTMLKTRNEIIGAAQDGIDAVNKALQDAARAMIDASDDMENALSGATAAFEKEMSVLSAAASAAEKLLPDEE